MSIETYVGKGTKLMVLMIPENATNGDLIKAMFPDANMEYRHWHDGLYFKDTDWWDSPVEFPNVKTGEYFKKNGHYFMKVAACEDVLNSIDFKEVESVSVKDVKE